MNFSVEENQKIKIFHSTFPSAFWALKQPSSTTLLQRLYVEHMFCLSSTSSSNMWSFWVNEWKLLSAEDAQSYFNKIKFSIPWTSRSAWSSRWKKSLWAIWKTQHEARICKGLKIWKRVVEKFLPGYGHVNLIFIKLLSTLKAGVY